MAEFLVRVIDKFNPNDTFLDVKCTKRGDVIVVVPDGHSWAAMELTLPQYRILRWPSVTVSEGQMLTSPELPEAPSLLPNVPDPMLQARGFTLNLDHLSIPKVLAQYLADDSRATPFFDVPATLSLRLLKTKRARRINPTVIG